MFKNESMETYIKISGIKQLLRILIRIISDKKVKLKFVLMICNKNFLNNLFLFVNLLIGKNGIRSIKYKWLLIIQSYLIYSIKGL